ncbi:unnamed protein product, partial [Chrysoparadoxa australica]
DRSLGEGLHPVHQYDGYFNTASGEKISILNPSVESIHLEDIAHALSNLCRFGGHTPYFYSVAQHSLLVMRLAEHANESDQVQLAALMHDATEAYVSDMIKPIKEIIGTPYEELEAGFEKVISFKFDIDPADFKKVKQYDRTVLEIEHATFFKKEAAAFIELAPYGIYDQPNAKTAFLHHFNRLNRQMGGQS